MTDAPLDREPTELERVIISARRGDADIEELMAAFVASHLLMPSRVPGLTVEELEPIVFDKSGVHMLALFTHPDRVGDLGDGAPYALDVPVIDLLPRLPVGSGVVVNPRHELGFEVPPTLLELLQRLGTSEDGSMIDDDE